MGFSHSIIHSHSFFFFNTHRYTLDKLDSSFIDIICEFEGKPLSLEVLNLKVGSIRSVSLTPSRQWQGEGLLGMTIRFDTVHEEELNEAMCHILDVEKGSPAERAGLRANEDFLLGTSDTTFDRLFLFLVVVICVCMYVYRVGGDCEDVDFVQRQTFRSVCLQQCSG